MNTRAERKWSRTTEHGRTLIDLFGLPVDTNPRDLYRALHRIERRANRYAERACNDETFDASDRATAKRDAALLRDVDRLLGFRAKGVPVFVEGDPRGYSLKIDCKWMAEHNADLHTDFAGCGIIAPGIT